MFNSVQLKYIFSAIGTPESKEKLKIRNF